MGIPRFLLLDMKLAAEIGSSTVFKDFSILTAPVSLPLRKSEIVASEKRGISLVPIHRELLRIRRSVNFGSLPYANLDQRARITATEF